MEEELKAEAGPARVIQLFPVPPPKWSVYWNGYYKIWQAFRGSHKMAEFYLPKDAGDEARRWLGAILPEGEEALVVPI